MIIASRKIANLLSRAPLVVGSVHSLVALRATRRLARDSVDLIEARIDAFADDDDPLPTLHDSKIPTIVTIRHCGEGGMRAISDRKRKQRFLQLLPATAMLDIELRSARSLAPVMDAAHKEKIPVIGSYHNFHSTPASGQLMRLAATARATGCDLLKIATQTRTPADLARLLLFLEKEKRLPVSVTGMGPLGKISRLLFASAGSVLNYGFLDRAQVSGQWPAALLKRRIAELRPTRARR